MTRKRKLIIISGALFLAAGVGIAPLWPRISRVAVRLRAYFALPVYAETIVSNGDYSNLIFLHHSTGRNLINEGNVRPSLTEREYQFWDHDFNHIGLIKPDGSPANAHYRIPGMWGRGDTDVAGLSALFSQPATNPPDNAFSRLLQHDVIVVKSCYPNSAIGDDETLRQFQTHYRQMRDTADAHSNHLFIIMTSPPLHPLGTNPEEAARSRKLSDWLISDDFLEGHPNLFVFDFFDLLADPDLNTLRTDYQMTPSEAQSHPNQLANETIGPLFVEFIDTAVQTYRNN
ncbi:MAG: hypothetical protein GY803_04130 [Chloroflexi bacterium]|nr:hypothetical protein [Chloroflexota bacterium]